MVKDCAFNDMIQSKIATTTLSLSHVVTVVPSEKKRKKVRKQMSPHSKELDVMNHKRFEWIQRMGEIRNFWL